MSLSASGHSGHSYQASPHAVSYGGGPGTSYAPGWPHTNQSQPQQQFPLYPAQYPPPNTSAPYAQAVPSPAPQVPPQRPTASSPPHFVPNAARPGQPNSHTPPDQYAMAAPPSPHSPTNLQRQQTIDGAISSPKSPQSPGSKSLQQQRVALLLSINVDLLEEVNRLQQDGRGGAISVQQQMALKNAGQNDKMASEEYLQCLRRVQTNLSYMMPHAQQGQESKFQPGPAYVVPPRHMPQLNEKYAQLKEMFPGWHGLEHRMSQSSASPNANPAAAAGGSYANGVNNTNA